MRLLGAARAEYGYPGQSKNWAVPPHDVARVRAEARIPRKRTAPDVISPSKKARVQAPLGDETQLVRTIPFLLVSLGCFFACIGLGQTGKDWPP